MLDTHLLIWSAEEDPRLSGTARALINDPDAQPVFSSASIWELAIKAGLPKRSFKVDPRLLRRALLDAGFEELLITSDHALTVLDLPPIHKDPFDRILIAQAKSEGIMLLTVDAVVAQYPGTIVKV